MHHALGALTPEQVALADSTLTDLGFRLIQQSRVINEAQEAGYDRDELRRARTEHARLLALLGKLGDEADRLPTEAFDEWLARVRGLDAEITAYETSTGERLKRAGKKRIQRMVIAGIVAVAGAGALAAFLWYVTQPGAVLARKGARKRRRAAARARA